MKLPKHYDRSTQFSFQLDEFNSTLQRTRDAYERRVTKPADVLFKEVNLWHALQYVKTSVTLNEGKSKKMKADIMVLNEKHDALTTHEKQVKELTEKVAKAEERTARLEKSLEARNCESQEMHAGFNSVQDTLIAQMKRIDGRINDITDSPPNLNPQTATRSPESVERVNQTSINRMDGFESSLASLENTLAELRIQ